MNDNKIMSKHCKYLNAVDQVLGKAETILICLMLVAMVASVTLQVIARTLRISIIWTEEAARYMSTMIAFLGIAYSAKRMSHIRTEILLIKLPAKVRKCVDILDNLICAAICIYLVCNCYETLFGMIGMYGTVSRIPMVLVFGALPLGCLFSAIHFLIQCVYFVEELREARSNAGFLC